MIYSDEDKSREVRLKKGNLPSEDYRSEWRRDYARLIHSPSFRRLKGKTQLFPGRESDFFRNRLTHSLEVAQIAKSIALRINHLIDKRQLGNYKIDTDIIEFAGLAHDLGHPPFGHIGEEALDIQMLNYGGFEGNAQTLRLLSKIEKKDIEGNSEYGITKTGIDKRAGLNLTYRSLASIIKYDFQIPINEAERKKALKDDRIKKLSPVKGYYYTEKDLVQKIKKSILKKGTKLKTVECQIMDLADDIAYSTYDLEDSFKAGFTSPLEIVTADERILDIISEKVEEKTSNKLKTEEVRQILTNVFSRLFDNVELKDGVELTDDAFTELSFENLRAAVEASNNIVKNGYNRTEFTSELVGKFIRAVDIKKINKSDPSLTQLKIDDDILLEIETLKHFIFQSQILSPRLKVVEYRGKKIIKELFSILSEDDNFKLMPEDFLGIYEKCGDGEQKMRCICDFIAGMTDRYAIEFYGRLTSEDPETIFKPH